MDKEQEKAFAEAFAALYKEDRNAVAEFIVEWINPNHIAADIVGQILGTRSLKPEDQIVKKVRKGIEVRILVPGAVHLASEITISDRINYILSGADIRVHANQWELEYGEIGTVQSIRAEMLAQLHDYYINAVFNALATLWNVANTPLFYAQVAGQINAATLTNMIDTINYFAGGVKAIMGTRFALTPMTQFAGFQPWPAAPNVWGVGVPSTIEEIQRTGMVGTYYGVGNIIALPQIWDNPEDYNALLPNDVILVIGYEAGEFITYGDVKWKQWDNMEPTPPLWNLECYQQWGLIVDKIQGIGVICIV